MGWWLRCAPGVAFGGLLGVQHFTPQYAGSIVFIGADKRVDGAHQRSAPPALVHVVGTAGESFGNESRGTSS